MILAIDASNIRSGGGLTHLAQILAQGNPQEHNISKVIIWSSQSTLDLLPTQPWLIKRTHKLLNKSFILTFVFQLIYISKFLKEDKVDLLFVPGGTFIGSFRNVVSMSQNMLPFEKVERNRFPKYSTKFKFLLLRITQSYTFKKSLSVIFLTEYAKNYIKKSVRIKNSIIISHGINLKFTNLPKKQREIESYTFNHPFKLLYVSIVTVYKHQWNIAEAIIKLRNEGYPIELDLVGDSTPESLLKLYNVMKQDTFNVINYKGLVSYQNLDKVYKNADGFIFGSSCENQPIILLEAMSAGLPILCSQMGPMPEVLGENQFYFNPLDVNSIYLNLKKFLNNFSERETSAIKSYERSTKYTWKECADNTFKALNEIYTNANNKK